MTQVISRFIKNPRLNTKVPYSPVRLMFNKKKDGIALLPMVAVVMVFLVLLSNFMYRRELIQINYEKIDTSLTDALLAGGVINYSAFGRTGQVMIQEEGDDPSAMDYYFANSYRLFTECLKASLRLDDGYNATADIGIIGAVSIKGYRVYNYFEDENGFYITEIGLDNGRGYAIRHSLNEPVYVNASDSVIEIKETSVYGQIGFRFRLASQPLWLQGMPPEYFEDDYTLTRLISIAD